MKEYYGMVRLKMLFKASMPKASIEAIVEKMVKMILTQICFLNFYMYKVSCHVFIMSPILK